MSREPRVWCTFAVKTKDGDLKLRMQDAPRDRLDDIAKLFAEYFAPEATFHKIAGVSKNKEAIEDCRQYHRKAMESASVVICCPDDGSKSDAPGEIISADYMPIKRRSDPESTDRKTLVSSKEMKKVFDLVSLVYKKFDAIRDLQLESLYDDGPVVVHPNYRSLGIAQKIFYVRRMVCKQEGIPFTGAWTTALGSQKAAERAGWETAYEISFEEIEKIIGEKIEGAPKTCKYMLAKSL